MSEYSDIRYEVDDPVATITLHRPQAMNAWSNNMDGELRDALSRAADDKRVVGIILTGEGRAFCAGADMGGLDALSSGGNSDVLGETARPPWADQEGDFEGRLTYLMAIDKPIIGAINGAVAGMAYPLALSCDMRVGSPKSLFVTAFAQRGLIAEWGLSALLADLIGPANALDLLMSSRRVDGAEARQLGLLNHMVDEPEELLPYCRDYVQRLASACSPASMAVMKRQVYAHLRRGLREVELESQQLMKESFGRPDFREGVSSFMEKRPPEFPRLGS